jgi:hypothetical protein
MIGSANPHEWILWHEHQQLQRGMSKRAYLSRLERVSALRQPESALRFLERWLGELPTPPSNLHLFAHGQRPCWESHPNGGTLCFTLTRSQVHRGDALRAFHILAAHLLRGTLLPRGRSSSLSESEPEPEPEPAPDSSNTAGSSNTANSSTRTAATHSHFNDHTGESEHTTAVYSLQERGLSALHSMQCGLLGLSMRVRANGSAKVTVWNTDYRDQQLITYARRHMRHLVAHGARIEYIRHATSLRENSQRRRARFDGAHRAGHSPASSTSTSSSPSPTSTSTCSSRRSRHAFADRTHVGRGRLHRGSPPARSSHSAQQTHERGELTSLLQRKQQQQQTASSSCESRPTHARRRSNTAPAVVETVSVSTSSTSSTSSTTSTSTSSSVVTTSHLHIRSHAYPRGDLPEKAYTQKAPSVGAHPLVVHSEFSLPSPTLLTCATVASSLVLTALVMCVQMQFT